jgi:hypothetical protein
MSHKGTEGKQKYSFTLSLNLGTSWRWVVFNHVPAALCLGIDPGLPTEHWLGRLSGRNRFWQREKFLANRDWALDHPAFIMSPNGPYTFSIH